MTTENIVFNLPSEGQILDQIEELLMINSTIHPSIWIVVKNTADKTNPRAASLDYVAEVVDTTAFEKMLIAQSKYAYRARSYGNFFPGWETKPRKYF